MSDELAGLIEEAPKPKAYANPEGVELKFNKKFPLLLYCLETMGRQLVWCDHTFSEGPIVFADATLASAAVRGMKDDEDNKQVPGAYDGLTIASITLAPDGDETPFFRYQPKNADRGVPFGGKTLKEVKRSGTVIVAAGNESNIAVTI